MFTKPDNDPVLAGFNYKTKEKGTVVALNCPNCGYPILFGEGSCKSCGSGLMNKVEKGILKFTIPSNAVEMKPGVDFSGELTLDQVTHVLEQKAGPLGYAYVVWREMPVLVGGGISAEKAVENFQANMKQKRRDDLGDKWTDAVQQFSQLLTQLESMSVSQRQQLGDIYTRSWGSVTRSPADAFFQTPSFEGFEYLSERMPSRDEAEAVTKAVAGIRKLLDEPKN